MMTSGVVSTGQRFAALVSIAMFALPAAHAEFTLQELPGGVVVHEDGRPVLVYNTDFTTPPEGVDPKYRRSSYIHPLYNADGEVVTED